MLASLTLTLSSCETENDKRATKMNLAFEQNDWDTALDCADLMYNDISNCSCDNILDMAFCYYLAAHSDPSNKYVKTWLTRTLFAVQHAQKESPQLLNDYLEKSNDGPGISANEFVEIIEDELEYLDNGGSLDMVNEQYDLDEESFTYQNKYNFNRRHHR